MKTITLVIALVVAGTVIGFLWSQSRQLQLEIANHERRLLELETKCGWLRTWRELFAKVGEWVAIVKSYWP